MVEHRAFLRVRGPALKVRLDEYFRRLLEAMTGGPVMWSWEAAQMPAPVVVSQVADDHHRHPDDDGR